MITLILILIAAICMAVQDKIAHHFEKSVFSKLNPLFWNPNESWRNKYKNGDPSQGPKFLGSTSIFAWTTDAWHLFKTLSWTAIEAAVALNTGYNFWISLIVIKAIVGLVFSLFYHCILEKED